MKKACRDKNTKGQVIIYGELGAVIGAILGLVYAIVSEYIVAYGIITSERLSRILCWHMEAAPILFPHLRSKDFHMDAALCGVLTSVIAGAFLGTIGGLVIRFAPSSKLNTEE